MYLSNNTKIQECIFNIDMICRSIFLSNKDFKEFKIDNNSTLYSDLLRYRYIQLCTILDEFEILNHFAKSDEYLRDTLYVISPLLKRIKSYNGIRLARNIMFAHLNRDKKKNFKPFWRLLKEKKFPNGQKEIQDIHNLIFMLNTFLTTRYYEDLRIISLSLEEEFNSFEKSNKKQKVGNNEDLNNLYSEVLEKMKEKNIPDKLILDPIIRQVKSQK